MNRLYTTLLVLLFITPLCLKAQISITGTLPFTYTQDFNSFAGTAASVPTGWTTSVTGNNYRGIGTGTSNTGGIWAYGTGSDYSMGGLASGTSSLITFTVSFVNNTSTTLTSLNVAYDFKQWRWGASPGNSYPLTATQTGIGASVSGLTQNSTPPGNGTSGVAAVTSKNIALTGLSIPAGASFSITWTLTDGPSNDNAMAIDNFSLTANGVAVGAPCVTPASPTAFQYTIAGPTQTNVSFTAPAGGASGYLAVISTNPSLSANPVAGTVYNINDAIGGGTVVYKGAATSFSATGLNPALDYYYYIFAYNDNCTGGPVYSGSLNGVDSLPAPVVTTDPSDSTACSNAGAAFHIAATNVLSYQWQEFSTAWNNLSNTGVYSGTTTNTLLLSSISGLDGRQYRCIVTGSLAHKDTSAAATVHERPATVITQQPANISVCAGANAYFKLHATGYNLSYQWQEDQGSGFSNLSNTAPYGGTTTDSLYLVTTTALMNHYRYRCILQNGCGSNDTTIADTLIIHANPVVQLTAAGSLSFCQNDSVLLQASLATGYTYQWQYNNSNITNAVYDHYAAYNAGAYAVTVTDSNMCSSTTAADTITVHALPTAAITTTGNTSICQGSSIVLSATTGTNLQYQWAENGSNIAGATLADYTAANNSNYTVRITDSNGCKNVASIAVTVLPFPTATATAAGNTTICLGAQTVLSANTGNGLTYQWMNNNTVISGATNNTYNAASTGNYSVVLYNAAGCSDTSTPVTVSVLPLPTAIATALGATVLCDGDSVLLHVNTIPGATYDWMQNGINLSAHDTVFRAISSGAYTVQVSNAAGCSSTSAAVNVVVNPRPNTSVTYSGQLTFCEDGAVVFTGSAPTGLSYQWMRDGSPIAGAISYSYIAEQTGVYTLLETNGYGCSRNSAGVAVTVLPKPQPTITKNGFILSTGTFSSYQWYFNGQLIPGATSQNYEAIKNGGYYVEVTGSNGCVNISGLIFVNNVGIANTSLSDAIRIYPNPANGIVHIDAPFATDIMIHDQLGKVLLDARNTATADMSAFADGVYFITVMDTDHQPVSVQKIVKNTR